MIKNLLVGFVLVLIYWILWHGSTIFEYAPYASLWFAPAGFSVAILLLWKQDGFFKAWICVWLVSILAQFNHYGNSDIIANLTVSSALAFGHTLPYWLATKTFNSIEQRRQETPTGTLLLPILYHSLLLAGSLAAATLGILSLITFGDLSIVEGKSIWLAWWIGDFVGVTLLAPVFVLAGCRYFTPWIDPRDTLLVQNSHIKRAVPIDMPSWISFALIISLPAIITIIRAEIGEQIPIVLAFFLSLLPIAVLTTRNSWAVVVTATLLSSLCIILAVKYFNVLGEGIAYQTTLLAIAITSFYFYEFIKSFNLKTQQLIETERSLATASKLLTLNELSANIAHELNTPLQTALTASQRVRRRLEKHDGDWSVEKSELSNIKLAIQQAGKTINNVRQLVKTPRAVSACCSVEKALKSLREIIEPTANSDGIKIKNEILKKLAAVSIDLNELVQILLNLVSNSIHSLKNSNSKEINISADFLNDSTIALKISDSGCGIEKSMTDKLFEIGSSKTTDGLGLGLWVSRSIAQRRGGSLEYVYNSDSDWYFLLTLKRARGTC